MGRRLPVLGSFAAPDLCGPCGGACCKNMPGAAMPADFGAPDRKVMRARLESALASGRWAVDWYNGHPDEAKDVGQRCPFVRPAVKGLEGMKQHGAWGGACTFLKEDGCSIFPSRPSGCRGLKPEPLEYRQVMNCTVEHSSKVDSVVAWYPYRRMLWQLSGGYKTGSESAILSAGVMGFFRGHEALFEAMTGHKLPVGEADD